MEIYAELTKKQLKLIDSGQIYMDLPDEVTLQRKHGSRVCFLETDEVGTFEFLKDYLDDLGISWQENDQ